MNKAKSAKTFTFKTKKTHRLNKFLKNDKERAREVAHGLVAWLQYELIVDRGCLLSERSLAQALGQLLAATGNPPIRPEWRLPELGGARLDFVQLDRVPSKNSVGEIVLAVETKFINGISNLGDDDIANDIARLALVTQKAHGSVGWLLIAGRRNKLSDRVKKEIIAGEKKQTSSYLPQHVDKESEFEFKERPMKKCYWTDYPWPLNATMKLLAKYELNSTQLAVENRQIEKEFGGMACYIWEVRHGPADYPKPAKRRKSASQHRNRRALLCPLISSISRSLRSGRSFPEISC